MQRISMAVLALALGSVAFTAYAGPSGEVIEYGYYQPTGDLERERDYNTAGAEVADAVKQ